MILTDWIKYGTTMEAFGTTSRGWLKTWWV